VRRRRVLPARSVNLNQASCLARRQRRSALPAGRVILPEPPPA
jgi:hypothetical protein